MTDLSLHKSKQVKHIPILFSTPMVQAILEGRKTQTRRIIKKQPLIDEQTGDYLYKSIDGREEVSPIEDWVKLKIEYCPYGQPGDVLWVRESFNYGNIGNGMQPFYKADHERPHGYSTPWKPSIHMPKSACRIFLQVEEIRVERLQDISEQDAINEGVEPITGIAGTFYKSYQHVNANAFNTAKWSFRTLWESINGDESWGANQWVWVVKFKRIEKPSNF